MPESENPTNARSNALVKSGLGASNARVKREIGVSNTSIVRVKSEMDASHALVKTSNALAKSSNTLTKSEVDASDVWARSSNAFTKNSSVVVKNSNALVKNSSAVVKNSNALVRNSSAVVRNSNALVNTGSELEVLAVVTQQEYSQPSQSKRKAPMAEQTGAKRRIMERAYNGIANVGRKDRRLNPRNNSRDNINVQSVKSETKLTEAYLSARNSFSSAMPPRIASSKSSQRLPPLSSRSPPRSPFSSERTASSTISPQTFPPLSSRTPSSSEIPKRIVSSSTISSRTFSSSSSRAFSSTTFSACSGSPKDRKGLSERKKNLGPATRSQKSHQSVPSNSTNPKELPADYWDKVASRLPDRVLVNELLLREWRQKFQETVYLSDAFSERQRLIDVVRKWLNLRCPEELELPSGLEPEDFSDLPDTAEGWNRFYALVCQHVLGYSAPYAIDPMWKNGYPGAQNYVNLIKETYLDPMGIKLVEFSRPNISDQRKKYLRLFYRHIWMHLLFVLPAAAVRYLGQELRKVNPDYAYDFSCLPMLLNEIESWAQNPCHPFSDRNIVRYGVCLNLPSLPVHRRGAVMALSASLDYPWLEYTVPLDPNESSTTIEYWCREGQALASVPDIDDDLNR